MSDSTSTDAAETYNGSETTPDSNPDTSTPETTPDTLDTDSASRADADLCAVIDAWPTLPQAVREAIARLATLTTEAKP